jgi:hypothetical protein
MRTRWLLGGLLWIGLPLPGQTLGEITGRVSDPSGAGVPDSALTLINTATSAVRQTNSTSDGFYSFPSLPPGFYNLKTEHPGFKTSTSNNIEVQVQQTVRLDLTLQVGQVNESVEVSAAADLLQAENATVGSVISNTSIVELPLNGREYLNLVALTSNANTLSPAASQSQSREGGDRSNQSISAGGNRIFFDYFTLDGVNNTDVDFNTYIVLPSIDAIQEFKVQTGVYPAEFGHGATQINVLTKSGGNAYHGALFEFLRNDDMDANNAYAFTANRPIKSPFKWNDYGYEIDGPVRIPKLFNGRNKLFFMSNFETLVQRQSSQAVYSVPTAAMQQGNYSAWPVTIYQPGTSTPFPGNIIPSNLLNPTSLALLKYYDVATLPGFVNNYTQYNQSPFIRDGFIIRMDYVESAKSQWSGRYSWGSEVQKNGALSITGTKVTTGYEQYLGSNTRIISPNVVNEARFGYSRMFNAISTADAFEVNTVGALNIPNLPAGPPVQWGVPNATFNGDGFSAVGDGSDDPYQISDNTAQVVDNLSWIKGKHTFKFGFEYNRQNFDQYGNQFLRGQFAFSANATQSSTTHTGGDAFAEFLLGDMFQSTVAFQAANAAYVRNVEAAFVDDTWKITPKLTLSLGLRYELTPPFYNNNHNLFSVAIPKIIDQSAIPESSGLWPYMIRQGNCSNPYTANPPIPFVWGVTPAVCSDGLENSSLQETRFNDFAPRVGVAYSPDSKTVVRVAFGEFFAQDNGNSMYFDIARNIGVRLTLLANTNGTTWGPTSGELTGLPATYANAATPQGGGVTPSFPAPYGYAAAYNHLTSYTDQYLVNVQRQLSQNWAIEVGYLGSESHHLYGFQNANQGIPGTVGSTASRYPFADFTTLQLVADGINAEYNSLSFKVTKRFSQGVSVISNYTWSKSIDDSSGIRVQGYDTLFPQNSYCQECDRSLSAFNVPQRLITSVLYDLPVGKGRALNVANPVLNAIVGGWQTGGTLTAMAGVPVSLSIGAIDNSETNEAGDRPNYVSGQSIYASHESPQGWYNPSAFVEAPAGTFGNVDRNSINSPGIFTIDAELHKEWTMPYSEHHRLQLRAEAFNVLNHPNFGEPNPNILAGAPIPGAPAGSAHAGFGVISGLAPGTTMRQLQVALKYIF